MAAWRSRLQVFNRHSRLAFAACSRRVMSGSIESYAKSISKFLFSALSSWTVKPPQSSITMFHISICFASDVGVRCPSQVFKDTLVSLGSSVFLERKSFSKGTRSVHIQRNRLGLALLQISDPSVHWFNMVQHRDCSLQLPLLRQPPSV